MEGGHLKEEGPAGSPVGTRVSVADLFYNVPARLKFMKRPATELSHIVDTVACLALAHAGTAFQLRHEKQPVFKTSGSEDLKKAMQECRFTPAHLEMLEVSGKNHSSSTSVWGYISRPPEFRGDRKGILALVNNRPVRCPLTFKALDLAYQDLIPKGRHPLAVLQINVDPAEIDVNIHPTKKEIKYNSNNTVYTAIYHALTQALRNYRGEERLVVPSSATTAQSQRYGTIKPRAPLFVLERQAVPQLAAEINPAGAKETYLNNRIILSPARRDYDALSQPDSILPGSGEESVSLPLDWRLLGYLHNTYFLIQTAGVLEIIEQHIAHERVIYERLLRLGLKSGRSTDYSQRLIVSVPLHLTEAELEAFEENLDIFRRLGFDFERRDDAQLVLTGVPLELAHKDYGHALKTLIADVLLTGSAELELTATKSIACQAAVKNGMHLSEAEIIRLIREWYHTPRNDTCPHGRPVRLTYSMDRLYQLFHPD